VLSRKTDAAFEPNSSARKARFRLAGGVAVALALVSGLALSSQAQREQTRLLVLSGLIALAVFAVLLTMKRTRKPVRRASVETRVSQTWPRVSDIPGAGLRSGDILGQYQLLTCVGQGGMGRVWAARRMGSPLQRLVAVKTGLDADHQTVEFQESFTDEARIASLLRHPNVCGVYEFGRHEGVLYQAMEWCDGASLRTVLDHVPEQRLDFVVAARIVASVSAGLHAAHQLEDDDGVPLHVVHRDVSPQNILISRRGQVKVTDFGVAKAAGQLHQPSSSGEIRGKAMYLAPEQITTYEVDQRTDIFALGCVLYEATVGRGPFHRDGSLPNLYHMLSGEVHSPRRLVSGYPEELEQIVLKALARDPRDRYQTAEELGVALEEWLARSRVMVTEQIIADLMTRTADEFIQEKARRIEQAMARLAPSASPLGLGALLPAPVVSMETGVRMASMATGPASNRGAVVVTTPAREEAAARPTIPAGRRRS
jgi:eukaryotic-like serine/threonine-protein kinase